jgi:hypothetical protein
MQRAHDRQTPRQLIDGVVLHVRVKQVRLRRLRQRVLVAVGQGTVERDDARRNQYRAVGADERVGERVVELILRRDTERVQRERLLATAFTHRQNRIGIGRRADDHGIAAALHHARQAGGDRRRRARDREPLECVILLSAQLKSARGQHHRAANKGKKRSANHIGS